MRCPGISAGSISHWMKNGSGGSTMATSRPASRQERTIPSGRDRVIGIAARSPRRGHGIDVVGPQAQRQEAAAARGSRGDPSPHRRPFGLGIVDDRHQFDVVVSERNDAVGGPVTLVPSAWDRCQSEAIEEAGGGLVEIAHRHDHVVDLQGHLSYP